MTGRGSDGGGARAWARSLHVGNVANVAYGYAKILARHGAPVELICHDIAHLMSQPEWDDLALDPRDFPDENDFRASTADLGGYRRPPWFKTATLDGRAAGLRGSALGRLARRLPASARRGLQPAYYRLLYLRERAAGALPRFGRADARDAGVPPGRVRELAALASRWGPDWVIDPVVLACYRRHAAWLAAHAAGAEVILSYALAPIYAMLYGGKPSISVEIGTMRDFPPGSSAVARLLWLAYRLSDHVIITNPDDRDAAERAGIRNYSFCPHPVDEAIYCPAGEPALRRQLQEKHAAGTLLLAPARQNWRLKGNDRMLQGFAAALAGGAAATRERGGFRLRSSSSSSTGPPGSPSPPAMKGSSQSCPAGARLSC